MKRAPLHLPAPPNADFYWRSLDERRGVPPPQGEQAAEFPAGAAELVDPVSRRSFLSIMGAGVSLATASACRRPEEKILPYGQSPENLIPGRAQSYATAFPFLGSAMGLLVESHEGRPTKVEGHPAHPDSQGGANVYAQAMVLDLYDVDRSQHPLMKGQQVTWDDVGAELHKKGNALKGKGGDGLWILTEAHRSPTLAAALAQLKKAMPSARVVRYDPLSRDHVREGARLAFGRPVETVLHTAKAEVILSLDADLFQMEGSPVKHARGFADGRRFNTPGATMNRLYVVESAFTVTGSCADHRLRLQRRLIGGFAAALCRQLSAAHGVELGADLNAAVQGFSADGFDPRKRPWIQALAKDLAEHRGRGLIVAGVSQPPAVHALCHLLNKALGNTGTTVTHVRAFDESLDGPAALKPLAEALRASQVDTLLMLGGNPAFTMPADVAFAEGLKKVPFSVHLSHDVNETSTLCTLHLNRAHLLESWSDVRAEDGTASVIQPLIAPMFGGRTDAEVVSHLLDKRTAHELTQATWKAERGGVDFDRAWRKALHDGMWVDSAWPAEDLAPAPGPELATAVKGLPSGAQDGFEVTFHPDSHALDGQFANNGWLQEMPDPLTKLTWDNAVCVSPEDLKGLGVRMGDVINLQFPKGSLALPVMETPGQAKGSLAITLGQGRRVVGRVGEGVGFDTYGVRTSDAPWVVSGVRASKAGRSHELARTQEHWDMENRPFIREATLKDFKADPAFPKKVEKHPPLLSVFQEWTYADHKWGMNIDLNTCIGCNACMVACQSENNIPIVGKWGVLKSREMHWVRVDRYYSGADENDPAAVFQPTPCMQCENAPCETVCPVAATTHSPEGLNDMAYNRCIGTRYCANNCPWKVRRYNFLNYSKDFSDVKKAARHGHFFKKDYPEIRRLQFNPNVTVRQRGVMEKCTYCVQRIQEAKLVARTESPSRDRLRDGEIVTACQQTCPTRAISFGDLNDPKAEVAARTGDPRNYVTLEELNVKPRTSYLAKVRNPNAELETA